MADTVADACKETVQNCLVTTDFTNITQGTGGPTNKYCQLSAKTLYYNLKLPENCHKLSIAFWFYGINYGYAWQDVFSFSTQRADNQQTLLRFESYGNGNYAILNNGHMSSDRVGDAAYNLQDKWTHLAFTIERLQTGTRCQYYENGTLKWDETNSYTTNGDVKFYNTYGKSTNFTIGEGKEYIATNNIKIKFSVWLTSGTDSLMAGPELKSFIKSYIESINNDGTNDLYISNLIREIENNFAYVHHLKFEGLNDYPTDCQSIINVRISLNDMTKEERRHFVPDLLTVNKNNIILNFFTSD